MPPASNVLYNGYGLPALCQLKGNDAGVNSIQTAGEEPNYTPSLHELVNPDGTYQNAPRQAISKEFAPSRESLEGRPSDGTGEDYALWCGKCRRVYAAEDVLQCHNCGNTNLVTRNQRKEELSTKVSDLKDARIRKFIAADVWKRHQSTVNLVTCPTRRITSHETWSKWVPDADDDEADILT